MDQRAAAVPHALRLPSGPQPADLGQSLRPIASTVSKAFAATLNTGTRPFHVVNYLGSLGGARVLGHAGMERLMDIVIGRLRRSVMPADEDSLDRGMHFPVGWDPYFYDYMTLRDVYHYATQHYDHHRGQLTLAETAAESS